MLHLYAYPQIVPLIRKTVIWAASMIYKFVFNNFS